MCAGHILLFGHVKVLILSLLSKSLPIKGREARPGRESGRAGFMPRRTKTSQASDGAASSSAAGDEEQTMDGDNRKKQLNQEEKAQQREQKLAFSKHMYAMVMAYLDNHLEHLTTEGKGDCWLLSILADFEVRITNLFPPPR